MLWLYVILDSIISKAYVTENNAQFYITEDGESIYVQEL